MIKKTSKTAFSIVELAIVVLITSLLIGGIIATNSLTDSARLSAARSMTKKSPVKDIDGLILWLETTMPQSIDELQAEDGQEVSIWFDLSPERNNATAGVAPAYTANVINGLPVLRFDGIDDFMTFLTDTIPPVSRPPEVINNNYTIFAVAARRDDEDINMIIGGTSGVDNNNLHMGYNGDNFDIAHFGQTTANVDYISFEVPNYTIPIFQIHSVTFNSRSGKEYYNNGGVEQASPAMPLPSATATSSEARTPLAGWLGASIGRRENDFFNGDIAEIIMFSKSLNNDERRDVEQYLSRKWDIEITQ